MDFDYDKFLAEVERLRSQQSEPCGVMARSLEEAEAFADWCEENDFERPKIRMVQAPSFFPFTEPKR